MLFNSYEFLLFFPIVVLIYYIIPKKMRYVWLLLASYYFYMCWNVKYVLLLFTSTLITYLSGLWIGKFENLNKKKWVVFFSFASNLGILFFFKYANFAIENLNRLTRSLYGLGEISALNILLPVGISFYIFQALSYTMDIYRDEIKAEKNFFKYALFVSFFPQLVAGPIERSKNLLKQINEYHAFDLENVKSGFMSMIWGYFLKLVIADRIAIFVNEVYGNSQSQSAAVLLIASILFAFEIYCDFAGYSLIAIGAAKVMGFQLMENFNSPYLAENVADFWRRWHISLSTWFKDYLYIPLGGNRKGSVRKYLNLMTVFLLSGLWHGANWTFVIWGGLNGFYQVIGDLIRKAKRDKKSKTENESSKIDNKKSRFALISKITNFAITFILIDVSWIFFRADNLSQAREICQKIVCDIWHTNWKVEIFTNTDFFNIGLNKANWIVLLISLVILFVADIMKYQGLNFGEWLRKRFFVIRWAITILGILVILVFGVYGSGYMEANFIYFQF